MLGQGIRGTEGRDVLRGMEPKGPFVPPMPYQGIGGTEGRSFERDRTHPLVPQCPARALGEPTAMDDFKGIEAKGPLVPSLCG